MNSDEEVLGLFSENYAACRHRFCDAAQQNGWLCESHPIDAIGPDGATLAFDVAVSPAPDTRKTIVVSSGIHGVEGFFGSAVQLALLNRWSAEQSSVKFVFLHGLNPYGLAWLRRFDQNNVDPNRNFLLPGELFTGAPSGYASLDSFLNPCQPPSRWEPFLLKAMLLIARYGMPALKQSVAAGQYTFPKGLFFGGERPSQTQQLLERKMPQWLQDSHTVVHLDFHTGLGGFGDCRLLIDYPLNDQERRCLSDWFGPDSFEVNESTGVAYDARGGFGRWCVAKQFAPEYLFACAEFGTYGPIQVLQGLRAENQAYHWEQPSAPSAIRSKQRLRELFCPASSSWRQRVIKHSLRLIDQAQRGLLHLDRDQP